MLMPPSTPVIPEVVSRMVAEDEPMTEGYGEPSQNARNMSGNVDFFSSLGTERQEKPKVDKPNPDNVSFTSASNSNSQHSFASRAP